MAIGFFISLSKLMPLDHRLKNCNTCRCRSRAALLSLVGVAAADRHVWIQASRPPSRGYLLLIASVMSAPSGATYSLKPWDGPVAGIFYVSRVTMHRNDLSYVVLVWRIAGILCDRRGAAPFRCSV
ncbi:hypothetical protein E2C01_091009 [Portunus trituberculatus]|uniref:Uncharacterized protein n=1 Tax=Portunus trituberculatus TaxID=210409 RepID=A0A5B7JMW9_PORTR|nr:hypothetical protein [Portunus trituberculatus]